MAATRTVTPPIGLVPVALLEFLAGVMFLGFILLASFMMLSRKGPMVELIPPLLGTRTSVPVQVAPEAGGVATRGLHEGIDRLFEQREEHLSQLLVGIGQKLDRIEVGREDQLSEMKQFFEQKLDLFSQVTVAQMVDKLAPIRPSQALQVQPDGVTSVSPPQGVAVQHEDRGATSSGTLVVHSNDVRSDTPPQPVVIQDEPRPPVVSIVNAVTPVVTQVQEVVPQSEVVVAKSLEPKVMVPRVDDLFNPEPEVTEKKGFFIALGCFSQVINARERGVKVRSLIANLYHKPIRDGAMHCVYAGPYPERGQAKEVRERVLERVGKEELSIGSY